MRCDKGAKAAVGNNRKFNGDNLAKRPTEHRRARTPNTRAAPGRVATISFKSPIASSAFRFSAFRCRFFTSSKRLFRASANCPGLVFHFFFGCSSPWMSAKRGGKSTCCADPGEGPPAPASIQHEASTPLPCPLTRTSGLIRQRNGCGDREWGDNDKQVLPGCGTTYANGISSTCVPMHRTTNCASPRSARMCHDSWSLTSLAWQSM